MTILLKRAGVAPAREDGCRVLVDRLWPRGISRKQLRLDAWLRELAPSEELRRWFNHEAGKWPEFRRRYFEELAGRQELLATLVEFISAGPVTLVYGARDERHNNAVALKEYLEALPKAGPGDAA